MSSCCSNETLKSWVPQSVKGFSIGFGGGVISALSDHCADKNDLWRLVRVVGKQGGVGGAVGLAAVAGGFAAVFVTKKICPSSPEDDATASQSITERISSYISHLWGRCAPAENTRARACYDWTTEVGSSTLIKVIKSAGLRAIATAGTTAFTDSTLDGGAKWFSIGCVNINKLDWNEVALAAILGGGAGLAHGIIVYTEEFFHNNETASKQPVEQQPEQPIEPETKQYQQQDLEENKALVGSGVASDE